MLPAVAFLKRDFRVVFPFGGFVVGSTHIVADQGHGFLEGGVAEGVPAFLPAFVLLAVFQHFVHELRQQRVLHAGGHLHVVDDIFIGIVAFIIYPFSKPCEIIDFCSAVLYAN